MRWLPRRIRAQEVVVGNNKRANRLFGVTVGLIVGLTVGKANRVEE